MIMKCLIKLEVGFMEMFLKFGLNVKIKVLRYVN